MAKVVKEREFFKVPVTSKNGLLIYRILMIEESDDGTEIYTSMSWSMDEKGIVDYLTIIMDKDYKLKQVNHTQDFLESDLWKELSGSMKDRIKDYSKVS